MNPTDPTRFDAIARAAYSQSLEGLSPRVQAQLAHGCNVATPGRGRRGRRGWAWMPAVAASLVAVALVSPRVRSPDMPRPAPAVAALPSADAVPAADDVLAEDPDLYLWLASRDAASFSME